MEFISFIYEVEKFDRVQRCLQELNYDNTELCSCSTPVLCYWFQKNKIKKNSLL